MRKCHVRGSTFTPGLRALPAEGGPQTASSPPAPDAPRCRGGGSPLPRPTRPAEGRGTASGSWKSTPSGGHHQARPIGAHRIHPRRTAPGSPPTHTGGSQAPPALQGPRGSPDRRGWSRGASPGQQLRRGAGRTEGRQPRSGALAPGTGLPSTPAAAASGSGSRASCLWRGRPSAVDGPRGSPSGWGAAPSVRAGSRHAGHSADHPEQGARRTHKGGRHARARMRPYQLWLLLGTPELYPDSMGRRGAGVGERARRWERCSATTRTGSRGRRTLARPGTSRLGSFQHGRSKQLGS